jgi:hypothetical protein
LCLSNVVCRFAIPWPTLDSSIPLLFEISECVSIELIVEGAKVWEYCDSSRWRWRPFLKMEVAGRAEEKVLQKVLVDDRNWGNISVR